MGSGGLGEGADGEAPGHLGGGGRWGGGRDSEEPSGQTGTYKLMFGALTLRFFIWSVLYGKRKAELYQEFCRRTHEDLPGVLQQRFRA
ncbi:MAG: hypothetical protein METHAR1v1_1240020 [Methanothrix sp.]|nr:MAG: hypothetical protein METHAR1v1_1240020 [Methanothrix sp.]